MRIYLIGFMCSGKSTVGKLLASLLGFTFYDVDSEIEKREKLTIPQIFTLRGEAYFRKLEKRILKEISRREKIVVSTGGGLGAKEENLRFMKRRGLVVWLDVNFSTFLKRCKRDRNRPLLKLSIEKLKELYETRKRIYSKADLRIKGELPPERAVKEILSALEGNSFGG